MTSAKRHAANQRNAQRSSGPRTDEGKRRASVNAMQHGLTTSVESSPWALLLQSVEVLLQSDGLEKSQASDLALCILNYERNVQYQRDHYLGLRRDGQYKPGHAGRYLRRAANQLIKQCRGLKS